MKLKYSNKTIGGFLLAFFMLCGIVAVSGSSAQAQYPYGQDPYSRDRDYRRDRDRDRDDRYRDRDDRYRDRDDRYRDDRYRRDDRYGRGGYNNAYQIARQQGYSNGLSTGAADAQRGQSYNPQRSHFWRNGSDGYNSSYGNRGQYKQVFRDAFVQGYREGYQRYGGYNRGGNNGRWGNGRWPW